MVRHTAVLALVLAMVLLGSGAARADDPGAGVPERVRKGVLEHFGHTTFVSGRCLEAGKRYVVLVASEKNERRKWQLTADGDGNLLDTGVRMDDRPAAVSAAVTRELPGSRLVSCEEDEASHRFGIFVETADGRTVRLKLEQDGKLVETREKIDFAKVPEAARKALDAKYRPDKDYAGPCEAWKVVRPGEAAPHYRITIERREGGVIDGRPAGERSTPVHVFSGTGSLSFATFTADGKFEEETDDAEDH